METLGTYSDTVIWRCSFSSYSSGWAGIGKLGEHFEGRFFHKNVEAPRRVPNKSSLFCLAEERDSGPMFCVPKCPDFAFNCEEPPPHRFSVTNAKSRLFKANQGLSRCCMFLLCVNLRERVKGKKWWALRDSNPRPTRCKRDALTAAPSAQPNHHGRSAIHR